MTRLIAFTGPAGCGKDTSANWFVQRGWTPLMFAGPFKAGLQAMGFGYPTTIEDKEKIIPWLGKPWRHLAQTLGTEWGRDLVDSELWVKLAEQTILAYPKNKFVITDLRFENEAALIRKLGGLVIHIEGRKLGTSNNAHRSEQAIETNEVDFTICNAGSIDELYDECLTISKLFNL